MEDPPSVRGGNTFFQFIHSVQNTIDRPITWFRGKIAIKQQILNINYTPKLRKHLTISVNK